ncbi:nef attachable domain protein, partial [Chlamydia psittaci 02DC14]
SFSESFFPVFNGRYFLFLHSPLWASKYHFANSTKQTYRKAS